MPRSKAPKAKSEEERLGRIRAAGRKYAEKNQAKRTAYLRSYRAERRKQFRAYNAKWRALHKEQIKVASLTHYHANKDRISKWRSSRARKIKQEVIIAYGGRCVCTGCTVTEFEFLTIDHINNDGAEERRLYSGSGTFYRRLKRDNFPKDRYRLLCFNCNTARGFYGYCPHEKV